MRVMRLVFKKNVGIFFKRCLFWKKTFSQDLVFLSSFFYIFFLNAFILLLKVEFNYGIRLSIKG